MDLYGILPFKSHWILPFIFMIFIMLPQNLTCLPWKSMVASDVFPIDAVPFSYWSGPYTLSSHSSMVQWKFEGLFTPNKQGRNPKSIQKKGPHLGNMVDICNMVVYWTTHPTTISLKNGIISHYGHSNFHPEAGGIHYLLTSLVVSNVDQFTLLDIVSG